MKMRGINRLKWFMDFIYAGLGKMEYSEICKLNIEIEQYLMDGLYDTHRSVDDMIVDVSMIEESVRKKKILSSCFRKTIN